MLEREREYSNINIFLFIILKRCRELSKISSRVKFHNAITCWPAG